MTVQAMDDHVFAREEGCHDLLDRADHPVTPSHEVDFPVVRYEEPVGKHAWLVRHREVRAIDS